MKLIKFNPQNEPYYSEQFIKGVECGALRQYEADKREEELDFIQPKKTVGKLISVEVLDKIKADIEALPKTYPFVNHIDMYVKEDDVRKIIDKYKTESEGGE